MIHIKNLTQSYKNKEVLNSINMNLEKGHIHAIMGKNGAGKTTLIKCLLNEIKYSGYIQVQASRNDISFLSDSPHYYDYLTGEEFVFLILKLHKKTPPPEELIQSFFEIFGFQKNEEKTLLKTYSFGMKKKTALISYMLLKPKLLILDEPTNGLDASSIILLKRMIKQVSEQGTTFIITSHDPDFVKDFCDSLHIIHNKSVALSIKDLKNNSIDLNEEYIKIIDQGLAKQLDTITQQLYEN